jgi:hypothetical protein
MKALIASIAISDGFNCVINDWQCCFCLLLLIATANSPDARRLYSNAFY